MKHRILSRVVCCQGTIQLAVAIHTLLHRQQQKFANDQPSFRNFLVVYDLFTAENQEKFFFDAIKRMAQSVMSWEAIIYLDPASINRVDDLYNKKGRFAFDSEMEKMLGISSADEIYSSRNWQKGSLIMLNKFSTAYKICYGDSIGLYFPESYFSNKDWWTRFRLSVPGKWLTEYKNKTLAIAKNPQRKPLLKTLRSQPFDYGYFCFPAISGDYPDFRFEVLPVSDLKNTFEKFIDQLNVPQDLDLSGDLCVLLTSNFSEAGRMSLDGELEAYIQFVKQHQKEKGSLLVKPHPRDSKVKIELLKKRFADESYSVFVLDDPIHFYMPFEFFVIKFNRISPGIIQKIKFFTVSSSCLSFWFLFDIKPYIGLGDELVKKHFQPDQVKGRLAHEEDLRKVIEPVS